MYNKELQWHEYVIEFDYQKKLREDIIRLAKNKTNVIEVFSNKLLSDADIIDLVGKLMKDKLLSNVVEEEEETDPYETLHEIVVDIDKHTHLEQKNKARNRSIGRSFIKFTHKKKSERIWLCNRGSEKSPILHAGITGGVAGFSTMNYVDVYDKDGSVTNKNLRQGKILAENKSGHFGCFTPKGWREFDIFDRSLYNQMNGEAFNLQIDWEDRHYSFSDIQKGLRASEDVIATNLELEMNRKAQEQLKKEREEREKTEKEAEAKRQEALRQAENERKRRELEEKQQREREEEERLRKEQERREQERQKQLEEEAKRLEEEKMRSLEKYTHALSFIRNQATLRNNPILDKIQNDIKFSHVHDGTALIIDGGPGTGKTTTLIQRLKLLISEDALVDYRMNEPSCKLSDSQIKIVSDEHLNWLFFSPNALLLQYLRSNMQYEGLDGIFEKTVVWDEHLKRIIRNTYQFAGDGCPFDFKRKGEILFTGNHLDVIRSFEGFYLRKIKENFQKVSVMDISQFLSWKRIGAEIIDLCKTASEAKDLKSLITILSRLKRLKDDTLSGHVRSITSLMENYTRELNFIANRYIVEWKEDKKLVDRLNALIVSWQKSKGSEEVEENEDEDDDEFSTNLSLNYHTLEYELATPLKSLLQRLAINSIIPGKEKLAAKQSDLYAIVKELIQVDQLKSLGESAYLRKYVAKVLKGVDALLLQGIPATYKEFRKSAAANGYEGWNQKVLEDVLKKNKNKTLYQQEQALLLGFVNNLIHTISSYDANILTDNNKSPHKYIEAYKTCRIPVIGVDECTDYSIMDYYAIASLRDNRVSSITLSGDIMQCMKQDGITDWTILKCPQIFPELEVGVLKTSYRQSPELMALAEHLYQITMGHPSPYDCHISSSELTPRPLWLDNDDMDESAEWMADRILEVHKAYGQLPSIAIFTKNPESARELKESFDVIDSLERAGIDVFDCSGQNANLKDNDKVRIFSIDNVKGMEFDVVFFYNIDGIGGDTDMINKYLYVALSRAAFFMAVTSDGSNEEFSDMLKSLFVVNGDWSSIIDAYRGTDIAISDSSEE